MAMTYPIEEEHLYIESRYFYKEYIITRNINCLSVKILKANLSKFTFP